MRSQTKKLAVLAMLSALAYLVMVFIRIPVIPVPPYLKYEPKDVIIVIGGFMYGPMASFMISVVVSFIEMITVSDTGIIGCIMNVMATVAFAVPASAIYKSRHTITGAVIGLIAGSLLMTAVMLLWNYFIVPIYLGVPRAVVAGMLLPVFLPFNLLKSALNSSIALVVYKPVKRALAKSGIAFAAPEAEYISGKKRVNLGVLLTAAFVIISCVMIILIYQGRI